MQTICKAKVHVCWALLQDRFRTLNEFFCMKAVHTTSSLSELPLPVPLFFFFYWNTVDLQCCGIFQCIAKWFSYIHFFRFFSIIGYYKILNIEFPVKVKVTQLWPTLWDPKDYTVHGILQARILEWAAFPFSRGSSQPRNQTQVSLIAGRFFTGLSTREAQEYWGG